MSQVSIRKAERCDAGGLFLLIRALADYERLDPPDEDARQRLTEDLWGPRPRAEAWLGQVNGKTVAYAFTFETYSTFLARPTLYLEDLFILPDFRRLGIGTQFFRHFAREAVARSCGRLEWACLDWNELALGFYRKLGAQRQDEWVSFRLTSDELRELAGSGD